MRLWIRPSSGCHFRLTLSGTSAHRLCPSAGDSDLSGRRPKCSCILRRDASPRDSGTQAPEVSSCHGRAEWMWMYMMMSRRDGDDRDAMMDSSIPTYLFARTAPSPTPNPIPIKLLAIACAPDFAYRSPRFSCRMKLFRIVALLAEDARNETFFPDVREEKESKEGGSIDGWDVNRIPEREEEEGERWGYRCSRRQPSGERVTEREMSGAPRDSRAEETMLRSSSKSIMTDAMSVDPCMRGVR